MAHLDDKLYEAATRLQGVGIPSSFMDVDDEAFRRLTPSDQSNVLHVAARCGNQEFISDIAGRVSPAFRYELLCKHNSKGETPLHLAAQFGDSESVHDADGLPFGDEKKPCWRERDNVGDTPLHKAVGFGHEDIALLLLQRDMESLVSVDNNVGESPTYLAADSFCPNFLRTILDADRNSQCSVSFSGPFGQTAFHPASRLNEEILSNLIERRKQLLHVQDNKGKTVLHYAVEENNSKPIVETLLKADSSLAYLHDNDGLTPLHRAAMMGFLPIIQTILNLSPQTIDIRDKDHGKTALHVAKMEACFLAGCLKKTRMKELINEVDNTILHLSLINSDLQSANALLEVSGINWRLKNKQGFSAMDLCKSKDQVPLKLKCLAFRWREEEITVPIRKFFHKKIRNVDDLCYDWDSCLDYRSPNGDSIFHIAARDGRMSIIRKAEQSNSNYHILLLDQNFKGETPLHLAAECGKLQVVKNIISICISVNRFRNENLQTLAENGEANQLIHDLKPWRMKSGNGDTPAHKALRNRHCSIALCLLQLEPELASFVNDEDESLLYLAAEKCCDDVLKEILNSEGYIFSIRGPDGQNPLHAAARNGLLSVSSLIRRQPDLMTKVDISGKTPLHLAAETERYTIIRKLLEEDKTAAFIYDDEGFTPLLRAAANGFSLCVSTILDLCPQSIELRDLINNRTMIHLAKMHSFVLLWNSNRIPVWAKLVNECDSDGNTPLHSAILDTDKHKALALLQTKGINWRVRNKHHQMPLDLCKQLIQNGNEEQWSIYKALEHLEQRRTLLERWAVGVNNIFAVLDGVDSMREEELNQSLNSIVVVTALLVTITFAALFSIPGGYNQDNGKAMQMKKVSIQLFVAFDVLALFTSIDVLLRYGYAVVFRSMLSRGRLVRGSIALRTTYNCPLSQPRLLSCVVYIRLYSTPQFGYSFSLL